MSRKTAKYTVLVEGRDKGKTFLITEMSAVQSELWAIRAFLAMANSGIDVPDEVSSMGLAGLAHLGLGGLSKIKPVDAVPLLEELMGCIEIIPDPDRNPGFKRSLTEDDVEDVQTRLKLKWEVVKLHFDFLSAAGPLTSDPGSAATTVSSNTPTSPAPSVQ